MSRAKSRVLLGKSGELGLAGEIGTRGVIGKNQWGPSLKVCKIGTGLRKVLLLASSSPVTVGSRTCKVTVPNTFIQYHPQQLIVALYTFLQQVKCKSNSNLFPLSSFHPPPDHHFTRHCTAFCFCTHNSSTSHPTLPLRPKHFRYLRAVRCCPHYLHPKHHTPSSIISSNPSISFSKMPTQLPSSFASAAAGQTTRGDARSGARGDAVRGQGSGEW